MLYFGSQAITAAYHGSTPITSIYHGSTLIWTYGGGTVYGDAEIYLAFENNEPLLPHHITFTPAGDQGQPIILPAGENTATLTGLDWNSAYDIDIVAMDGVTPSTPLTVVLWTSPELPPVISIKETIIIQFEDSTGGTLPHRIYSLPVGDESQPITLTAGDTEHVLTGLEWNTEYTVSIFSFDDLTESNELTVDIWTAPEDAPTLAAAATGENSITLTITPPAETPASLNAGTGYSIEQSPNGTTGWTEIELVAVGDQPAEVTGLAGNTAYWFRARSVNGNPSPHDDAFSGYSATANESTDADVTAPTLSAVTATPGDTTADLTMTSSETGNIWWSITTNATETAADIKAATGAVDFDTAACTAATPVTPTATGLTNGVTYYLHVVAEDGVPNQSAVTNTAGFVPAVMPFDGFGNASRAFSAAGSASAAGTNYAGSFTVALWLKTSQDAAGGIVGKSGGSNDFSWLLYKATSDVAVFYVATATGTWAATRLGTTLVNDGQWHHICAVFDAGVASLLYVDGVAEGSLTGTVPAAVRASTIGLRIAMWNNLFLAGNFADLRIFSGALNATQVADLASGDNVITGLATWYFDDDGDLLDKIGSDDLTASGTSAYSADGPND